MNEDEWRQSYNVCDTNEKNQKIYADDNWDNNAD